MSPVDPSGLPQQAVFPGAGQARRPRRSDSEAETRPEPLPTGEQYAQVGEVLESVRPGRDRPMLGYDRAAQARHARVLGRMLNLRS